MLGPRVQGFGLQGSGFWDSGFRVAHREKVRVLLHGIFRDVGFGFLGIGLQGSELSALKRTEKKSEGFCTGVPGIWKSILYPSFAFEFGVWSLGIGVQVLGFSGRVQGLGVGAQGFGIRNWGLGLGFRVEG